MTRACGIALPSVLALLALTALGGLLVVRLLWLQERLLKLDGERVRNRAWAEAVHSGQVERDLDADRVGVFWALLFLCHQGKVELEQQGGLFGPLSLRRILVGSESVQLPLAAAAGSAQTPALEPLAA